MTKLLSVPPSVSDSDNLCIWSPVEAHSFLAFPSFLQSCHSYFIQLFGVFQSKLIGSIMDFDLDVVNPEEEEQEERLESGESLIRHFKIHSGEKLNQLTNATMHLLGQPIWGHIWKGTVEKSQTNATDVTLLLFGQAIWGDIWKRTVEKSQTNATNVTMHLLRQAIWRHIWKRTVEKV